MQGKKRALNVVTSLMIIIYSGIFFYFWMVSCNTNDKEQLSYAQLFLTKFTAFFFLLLSIIFFTSGVIMIKALQRNFPEFLKKFKCLMWTTTVLISVPLSIRSILDFTNLSEYVQKHSPVWTQIYNLTFFMFTTYLPILFQICTLVFGFVRRRLVPKTQSEGNQSMLDDSALT